jgi:hypothetical protein
MRGGEVTATKEEARGNGQVTTGPESSTEDLKKAPIAAEVKPIDLAALEVETVEDYFHAPTETFLVRNDAGRWLPFRQGSYKRLLVSRGMNGKAGKGEAMAETDLEIVRVQTCNDVSRYGPLCGRNSGFYDADGSRVLVTEDMRLIEPMPGKAPTIHAVIKGLFHDGETEETGLAQLHTFFGWLKSSVEALRAGRQQQQQALAICGVKDCGKSFVQHHIVTPCLAGRSADAERYFLRGNDFNSDLFNAEHLTLDDCQASTAIRDRLQFAARLKGHTVGATVKSCHGKGRDAVTVRPWWRITITLNDDPESLLVLPPLNEDFADKLILLRASRFDFPQPITSTTEKERFERKLYSEIPAFLNWLLNAHQIPEEYADRRRYNIATFHHPELKRNLESLSPESELLALIDLTLADNLRQGPQWITAEDLENRIRATGHHRRAESIFTYRQACAKYLHRLSLKKPDRVQKKRESVANGWLIFPADSQMEGVEGDY